MVTFGIRLHALQNSSDTICNSRACGRLCMWCYSQQQQQLHGQSARSECAYV